MTLGLSTYSSKTTGYSKPLDDARLETQLERIRVIALAASGIDNWMTLRELRNVTGYGEASISAQLRHLRKTQYGGYTVSKRRRGTASNGLWEYLVTRSN